MLFPGHYSRGRLFTVTPGIGLSARGKDEIDHESLVWPASHWLHQQVMPDLGILALPENGTRFLMARDYSISIESMYTCDSLKYQHEYSQRSRSLCGYSYESILWETLPFQTLDALMRRTLSDLCKTSPVSMVTTHARPKRYWCWESWWGVKTAAEIDASKSS
jgi:hypothetical protein